MIITADAVDLDAFFEAMRIHSRCVTDPAKNWILGIHMVTHVLFYCCFCKRDAILVKVER